MLLTMAMKSFYKGESLGNTPPCAICGGKGVGARALLHLTHGVSVWLCAGHRDPSFVHSRAGRDLMVSLGHVWAASNCLTRRRNAALLAHMARVGNPQPDHRRPGSYAWPSLRGEAERRFHAGEPPARVIADLRTREARGSAVAPSVRTMRRWFTEGRWLSQDASAGR
jgi:hypothetical protein